MQTRCSMLKIFQKYGGLDNVLNSYYKQTNICAKKIIKDMEQFKIELYEMFKQVSDVKKFIFPALLRIMRCGKRDINWLTNLETKWKYNVGIKSISNSTAPNAMFGGELYWTVISSIIIGLNQTEIVPKTCENNWICSDTEYKYFNVSRAMKDSGLLVPDVSLAFPITNDTSILPPVLGLNGDLDGSSPLSSAAGWENDFSASRSLFVPVKGGEYNVVFNLWNPFQNYRSVGYEILREFMMQATKSTFNVTATRTNIENLIKENVNYNFIATKEQFFAAEIDRIGVRTEILPLYDENYNPEIDDITPASGSQKKTLAFFSILAIILSWAMF